MLLVQKTHAQRGCALLLHLPQQNPGTHLGRGLPDVRVRGGYRPANSGFNLACRAVESMRTPK